MDLLQTKRHFLVPSHLFFARVRLTSLHLFGRRVSTVHPLQPRSSAREGRAGSIGERIEGGKALGSILRIPGLHLSSWLAWPATTSNQQGETRLLSCIQKIFALDKLKWSNIAHGLAPSVKNIFYKPTPEIALNSSRKAGMASEC